MLMSDTMLPLTVSSSCSAMVFDDEAPTVKDALA